MIFFKSKYFQFCNTFWKEKKLEGALIIEDDLRFYNNFKLLFTKSMEEYRNNYVDLPFIANYEDATIAVWHFVSPDGQIDMTYTGAQEFFAPVEIIDGMYSTMQLKNIPLQALL